MILLSSCAWFTSKPKVEEAKKPPASEDIMAPEVRAKAENYVSDGISYHQNGKDSLAVIAWKKALELIPGDAEIHNFLGISYHKMNQLEDAIVHFKIATELDPEYYQALNNLGYIQFLQNKYKEAKESFEKTLKYNPEYQPAKLNLRKLNDIADGKLSRKIFELSESAGYFDNHEMTIEEYIQTYKAILSLDPTNAEGHNNIGVAYYYYGDIDSAYAHLNKALELRKNYPEAINNLGFIYKVAGRYEEAIKLFLTAVSTKKEYILALINLGETYQLNGEFENARRVFKTVLDLNPDNEFAKDSFEQIMQSVEN